MDPATSDCPPADASSAAQTLPTGDAERPQRKKSTRAYPPLVFVAAAYPGDRQYRLVVRVRPPTRRGWKPRLDLRLYYWGPPRSEPEGLAAWRPTSKGLVVSLEEAEFLARSLPSAVRVARGETKPFTRPEDIAC